MNFETALLIYFLCTLLTFAYIYHLDKYTKENVRGIYCFIFRFIMIILYSFSTIWAIVDIILIFICIKILSPKSSNKQQEQQIKSDKISKLNIKNAAKLETLGILDTELLSKELYDIFLKYEDAFSNFNYELLEDICTQNFLKTTNNRLNLLKAKKQKRMFSDITLNNFVITAVSNKKKYQEICMTYDISLSDNIIDCTNNIYINGSEYSKRRKSLHIKFVNEFENSKYNCSNCGAPLKIDSTICEYCNTIGHEKNDWKIDFIK